MDVYFNFISNNPVLFILFFVILGFIIFNEYKTLTQKFKNISPQDAVFLINNDAFILDVRESSELSQGLIKDSKHINFSSVQSQFRFYKKNIVVSQQLYIVNLVFVQQQSQTYYLKITLTKCTL